MGTKDLIINSENIGRLSFGKLSKTTATILIGGRLPMTNHIGNISYLFFQIKTLTLIR